MNTILQKHFDAELLRLASPLPRVPFTSIRQIEQHIRSSEPVVFTGALEHWPASSKWSPGYFRSQWGERSLRAHETTWQGNTPYLFADREGATRKSITELLEAAATDKDYDLYIHQIDAAEVFPGSLDDLKYESLIDAPPQASPIRPNIWMGTPGTRSGLHFDFADNLVAIFHGMKAVMLVDPVSPKLLYPFPRSPTKSQINPMCVSWERFERLKQARIYIDALQPGELMLLPCHWWHYFTSLKFTINSTCWFRWRGIHTSALKLDLAYVSYLLRCGPAFPLQSLHQFFWHGLLQRPYEERALTPPPHGVRFWSHLRRLARPRKPTTQSDPAQSKASAGAETPLAPTRTE